MKITEKQLMVLIDLLRETLTFDKNNDLFSWRYEYRRNLYTSIIDQQSNEIQEIK